MSWSKGSTESFTVSLVFHDFLELANDPNAAIEKSLKKNYVGTNYQGKYIVSLVSVDNYQEPFINNVDAFVTMIVQFTAQCIRLLPNRIIHDMLIQEYMPDSQYGVRSLGTNGSDINVIYDNEYNDIFTGAIFPTVIRKASHSPHARNITVMGDVLIPPPKMLFYKHDGSTSPNDRIERVTVSQAAEDMFNKIRVFYDFQELAAGNNLIVTGNFNHQQSANKIYTLRGPFGPIIEVENNTNIGTIAWKDIVADAALVNMYDIEINCIDASNAIKQLSEMYASDKETAKKIQPYLIFVKNKVKQRIAGGRQKQSVTKQHEAK